MTVRRAVPVTDEALDEWIATVRRGEIPDPEVGRLVAEVLSRWLDGEPIDEILGREPSRR